MAAFGGRGSIPYTPYPQTLRGSFSALSMPPIARVGASLSIFRYLHDLHTSAPLQSQSVSNISSNFVAKFPDFESFKDSFFIKIHFAMFCYQSEILMKFQQNFAISSKTVKNVCLITNVERLASIFSNQILKQNFLKLENHEKKSGPENPIPTPMPPS